MARMRHRLRRGGIWRNRDFLHLWGAATVSTYGSLVTRTALPFAAILLLDASPAAISALQVAELLPAFIFGLIAGAWVDRLRRRPIMIATDLGRALLLATIPLAAALGALGFGQLYVVAAITSVLSVLFDVAYQSYLPTIVKSDELIEANSRISAANSVAEAAAFSSGGWLVQLLTAPMAILVDAATFIVSAGFIARMPTPETRPAATNGDNPLPSIASDVVEGLRAVWREPLLRGMIAAGIAQNMAFGLFGTVFLLYVNQEIGFNPGILGLIFAVGGVSAFLGAMIANRLPRFGIGAVMIVALLLTALGEAFVPLATTANALGVALLVGQQLVTDSALTVYDINQVSLRQAIAPSRLLGRVNASVRVTEFGALLAGTVLGGYLGESLGLRGTLWLGVAFSGLAALALAASPVRAVLRLPQAPIEVAK
jgi:MFS family permease